MLINLDTNMNSLYSMQIKESSLLYAPYESIITNNGECFKANLYSINMSNFIQYAFIIPKNIGSIIKIKLIYKLEKINSINIAQNEMKLIICYHHYICSNLLQSKKNIKCDIDTYFKNIKNIFLYQ